MRFVTAIALILTLGGCTSSRHLTSKPVALQEVNQTLLNREAIILKTDGYRLHNVRNVLVGHTYTRYHNAGATHVDSLLTEEVASVALPAGGRVGSYALGFASPGLFLLGIGGIAWASVDSESENISAGIVGYAFTMVGIGAAILGAVIGAVVGSYAEERPPKVIYEGPLSRYSRP